MRPSSLAKQVSYYAKALADRGWVANHDGNVSARLDSSGRFLITPTGVSKRLCDPETIVGCRADGTAEGKGRPPSEVALHVGAYRARSDVSAVVHAHPIHASAFALARRPLKDIAMPEVVVSIGPHVPVTPMVLPKQPEAVEVAAHAISSFDVVLLAGNGVLAVGPDLETAYLRMELVEHYARIVLAMEGGVGKPAPLTPAELDYLIGLRKKAGLHREPPPETATEAASSALRSVVEEEVRRILGKNA